jgi:hypothetical protein
VLRVGDGLKLGALVRSSTVEAGLAQRARIVLLAAEGLPNAEIARRVGALDRLPFGYADPLVRPFECDDRR